MPQGAGIPRHRHTYMDEFFYILEGSGTVLLNDQRMPIQKGDTIFIPKGSWHAFENPGTELFLLFATTPTGQENYTRARTWVPSRKGGGNRHGPACCHCKPAHQFGPCRAMRCASDQRCTSDGPS